MPSYPCPPGLWHTVLSIIKLLCLLHWTLGFLGICFSSLSSALSPVLGLEWAREDLLAEGVRCVGLLDGSPCVLPRRCSTTWCCTSRCSCVSSHCGTGSRRGTGGARRLWTNLHVSSLWICKCPAGKWRVRCSNVGTAHSCFRLSGGYDFF